MRVSDNKELIFKAAVLIALLLVGSLNALEIVSADAEIDRSLWGEIRRIAPSSDEAKTIERIRNLMIDRGYWGGGISKKGDTLNVSSGVIYRIGRLSLQTVMSNGDLETKNYNSYRGIVASRINLNQIRSGIVSDYQNRGNYFASLHTTSASINDSMVDFDFKLVAGPEVLIDRIRFKGLSKTSPRFAARLSGLESGQLLLKKRLTQAIEKIEAGRYLRNDSLPELMPNENYDAVSVLFFISELKTNRLELAGGYIPGRGGDDGELVGRLDFKSKNLFGSGRTLELILDRKDRLSSRVEFLFRQPFFVPDHLEAELSLTQIDYDSSYHMFNINGGLGLYIGHQTLLSGQISWTRTEPQRGSQVPSRTLAGRLKYRTSNFDYIANPAGGGKRKIDIELSYIRRTAYPDSVSSALIDNESMLKLGADNYFSLWGSFVLRLNLRSQILFTSRDLIDYSEQFKLGGYNSLRGYRQEQFSGRRIVLGQGELRWRPSYQLAIYLFGDAGYVYRRKQTDNNLVRAEEITRFGQGLGLFVGSDRARMVLEIGWGYRDRIGEGKLHLGLVTLF